MTSGPSLLTAAVIEGGGEQASLCEHHADGGCKALGNCDPVMLFIIKMCIFMNLPYNSEEFI